MPARILRKEELLLLMMGTATMEISSFLKKTKNRITICSSRTIPRHTHTTDPKSKYLHAHAH